MTFILDLLSRTGHNGQVAQKSRSKAGRPRVVKDPERIAVDLEKPDLDALRTLGKRRGTSVANLIRRAVSQYLHRAREK
jgi:hypothetical protein